MAEIKTPKDVLELIKKENVKMVDLRFMDFPGIWQHCSYPISQIDEDVFAEGLGFDGSSIRGWRAINESDMLIIPVPSTAFIDPFTAVKTLVMICNIQDPVTGADYTRDPRNIAIKAENYLKKLGLADTAFFLGRKRNSLSSMTYVMIRKPMKATIILTAWKVSGTAAELRIQTWAIKFAIKKGIFLYRLPIA
jgi:glutamine synthetase